MARGPFPRLHSFYPTKLPLLRQALVTGYTHSDKRKRARSNEASAGSARESVPPDPADLVAAGLTRPGDFDAIVEELGGGRQRISWVLWAE